MTQRVVYKICPRSAWQSALVRGAYEGSEADRRDGFIHLSNDDQVEETAARHFGGQRDLVLVALDAAALGPALRDERSRGGALFPHYHGAMPTSAALWVEPLPLDHAGGFAFPDRIRNEKSKR